MLVQSDHRLWKARPHLAAAICLVAVFQACGAAPPIEWDALPECATSTVNLPTRQAKGERETSEAALACFQQRHNAEQPVQLTFNLVGAEGQHYQALLQFRPADGVFFRQQLDRGWQVLEGCAQLDWPFPGFPVPRECQGEYILQ